MPRPDCPVEFDRPRLAFIGGGNMARSLIAGLVHNGHRPDAMAVGEPNAALRDALTGDFGVAVHEDNRDAVAGADLWLLAVKPQVLSGVCAGLAEAAQRSRPLVVSIAAGVTSDQIERWLGGRLAVVRAMPNTPALVGAGATGLFANANVDPARKRQAQTLLDAVGRTVWVPEERLMDAVTAVSGSGPAYFLLLVEALQAAAERQGLEPATARLLSVQTALGAARMLVESGEPADTLRKRVTSPGGTTAAAVESLLAEDLPGLIGRAVAAATRRGAELARENDDRHTR